MQAQRQTKLARKSSLTIYP